MNFRGYFWFYTVAVSMFLGLLLGSVFASALALSVQLSSIGYHPEGPKKAILDEVPAGLEPKKLEIEIYDPNYTNPTLKFMKGKTLYQVTEIERYHDPEMQGPVTERWVIDFSDFTGAGEFELRIKKPAITVPLKVDEFTFWDTMIPSVRTFFLMRSGMDFEDSLSGLRRGASHLFDAYIEQNGEVYRKDVAGGWYNDGDYGKFTTTTAISLAQMLSLYEMNPVAMNYLKMTYPIHETALGDVPDYLHELRFGLEWLMTMQRNDGAFYRKISGKAYPDGLIRPEDDDQQRFIYGVSTQDTAMATAALATAVRSFKLRDYGYAVKCLLAAERGWKFLAQHPEVMVDVNLDDDSGSREYLNPGSDKLYRIWAATELYLATGKQTYHDYLLAHYEEVTIEPLSWKNPTMLGFYHYVAYGNNGNNNTDKKLSTYLKAHLYQAAKILAKRVENNPYNVTLRHIGAESNLQLLQHQAILLQVAQLTGKERFRDAAASSVQYLFGLNPLNKTFVTGIANNSVEHPCHRLLQVTRKNIPGMLVSGPDNDNKNPYIPSNAQYLSYRDSERACEVNHTEIRYNAALIRVLGMLNALYNNKKYND